MLINCVACVNGSRLADLTVEDARHGHQRPKLEEYGDSAFAVMHLLEQDNNIRDSIGTAIQVNLFMVTIEDGDVNKKLVAWAGIFAVVTACAGIWGMNFTSMPELQWDDGYPVARTSISAASIALYFHFRRVGWL